MTQHYWLEKTLPFDIKRLVFHVLLHIFFLLKQSLMKKIQETWSKTLGFH